MREQYAREWGVSARQSVCKACAKGMHFVHRACKVYVQCYKNIPHLEELDVEELVGLEKSGSSGLNAIKCRTKLSH
mgnify:CR=1 FL=1